MDTITNLGMLHPFFRLPIYYPERQLLNFELSLKDDSKILVVKDGNDSTIKYKLTVESICLRLRYATFESRLREKWLGAISNLGLRRNLIIPKSVHFNIKASSQTARFSSIFNFSILPSSLTVHFCLEKCHLGTFKDTNLCFKHFDLKSIKLFKSGVPFNSNNRTCDMDVSKINGLDHYYWYDQFVRCFGPKSADFSLEAFHEDMFIYCFNLSNHPRIGDDYGILEDPSERKLSLLQGANLDIEVVFKQSLPSNTLIFFTGWYDVISSFSPDGEVLDD